MPWDRNRMAARAAEELEDGMYVNLGIGIPTLVANYVGDKDITLQSENGMLGMGPFPYEGEEDPDLIDDLPPRIELPNDVLARYEGRFAYDLPGAADGERTESDSWVADIYADSDGTMWIDFNDQPRLEIWPYSETEFQMKGYDSKIRFIVDPETGESTEFVNLADGTEQRFFRQ